MPGVCLVQFSLNNVHKSGLKHHHFVFQNHIHSRQLKRQEDDMTRLQENVERGDMREKELLHQCQDYDHRIANVDAKVRNIA